LAGLAATAEVIFFYSVVAGLRTRKHKKITKKKPKKTTIGRAEKSHCQ
jgi:hypothetical protein